MFKLIKLAIYGLIGYALYEFVRGITTGEAGQGQQSGSRELNESLDYGSGRTNMTGPGRGDRVTTSEPSGESMPHTVGRGVVH